VVQPWHLQTTLLLSILDQQLSLLLQATLADDNVAKVQLLNVSHSFRDLHC